MGALIQGVVPVWAKGSGPGSGSGDDDGDGSGHGSGGYGDGYGDGHGHGHGHGYGRGEGEGSGSGYGHGYGDGESYGSGSGYGHGEGDGSGSGDGEGYGDGFYWASCVKYFAAKWTQVQRARLLELKRTKAKIVYWRSDESARPANGGHSDPVKPGDIQREKGPLHLCSPGTLHATLIPTKWKGERWWIVALKGEVIGDDEKYGALEREIIGECL